MNYLYYGNGNCSVEGKVNTINIKYQGIVEIFPKIPDAFNIIVGDPRLIIVSKPNMYLGNLFEYSGEFKIISVLASLDLKRVSVKVKSVLDYAEFINSTAESMTIKSENMNASYTYKKRPNKTRIRRRLKDV